MGEISYTSGNVNYYKNVHHAIPTLPVEIGNILEIVKANQWAPLFNWVSKYILFLAKPKRLLSMIRMIIMT